MLMRSSVVGLGMDYRYTYSEREPFFLIKRVLKDNCLI